MSKLKGITKKEAFKLNESMPPEFYVDINDENGTGYYYEDQLIGYPKSLGELIYMAYKYGFDECKVEIFKSTEKMKLDFETLVKEFTEIMKDYNKVSNQFNENIFNESIGKEGYVYFLSAGDYIKIGYSETIHQRINQLQTGCPFKLELVSVMPGTMKTEKMLHNKFNKHRYNNEWFEFCLEIREFIESMKAKTPRMN